MQFCTECGNKLEAGDLFCPNCGTRAYDGSQVADQTVPLTDVGTGAAAGGQAQFGGQVAVTPPETAADARTGSGKRAAIVAIAAVIAIAAIAAAFLMGRGCSAQADACSVVFETSGRSAVEQVQVDQGASLASPQDPTREGYRFAGWYLDEARTQAAHFPLTVDADTVLYAKWEMEYVAPYDDGTDATGNSDSPSIPGDTSGSAASPASGSAASPASSSAASPSASSGFDVVTVELVGTDGRTRRAEVRREKWSQLVIPHSLYQKLTKSDIAGLTDVEKCIAWNEIIAQTNGYVFKNRGLRSYFNGCDWYHPDPKADGGGSFEVLYDRKTAKMLSDNVQFLKDNCSDRGLLSLKQG